MLRLTIVLFLAMAAAWVTLGRDQGQLRPGLAKAAAEGRLDEVWAAAQAREEAAIARRAALAAQAAQTVPEASARTVPLPLPATAAPAPAPPAPPPVAPAREVVQVLQDPVFSLESFGNEPIPGQDAARAPVPPPVAPAGNGDSGRIWYVTADSVNVRAGPSTEAEILGRLSSGEALLMVAAVNDEWTRIVIQGDGVEGYVATRFLSPVAP